MKILIATPFFPPEIGILATYAHGLEGAFERKGHVTQVVTLSAYRLLPWGIRHLVYFLNLTHQALRADYILALDTWSVGVPALYASRIAKIPLIVRIGGDFLWECYVERTGEQVRLSDFYTATRAYSFKERMIFKAAQKIVMHAHWIFFNTEFQKNIWLSPYAITASRVSILENFYPKKDIQEAPSKKVFVCATRNTPYKNTARFASVFERVKARHPDIILDMHLASHDAQLDRLKKCYAVVIPSVSEVGSNTAIEAVSYGRPFITTTDTGTSERLAACGLFVDTRSEEELERALENILDESVYDRLTSAARVFPFEHSWDDLASEILEKINV